MSRAFVVEWRDSEAQADGEAEYSEAALALARYYELQNHLGTRWARVYQRGVPGDLAEYWRHDV